MLFSLQAHFELSVQLLRFISDKKQMDIKIASSAKQEFVLFKHHTDFYCSFSCPKSDMIRIANDGLLLSGTTLMRLFHESTGRNERFLSKPRKICREGSIYSWSERSKEINF